MITFIKILPTLLLTSSLSISGFGKERQKNDSIFVSGEDFIHQKDIQAHTYAFNKTIHKIYFDSVTNNITLQIGNGEVVAFSLNNNYRKWTQKINFNKEFLYQKADILIQLSDKENYRLNMQTGYKDFPLQNSIFHIDVPSKMGLGFIHVSKGISNQLVGVNLKTGKISWKREISRDYSLNYLGELDYPILLFTASGLHAININDGKGWDYCTETGEKSYLDVDSKTAVGKKIGLWGGTYSKYDGSGLLTNISSNVLKDTNNLYYASQERLAKLDKLTGKILWSYNFKDDEASTSRIFFRDSTLIMLNMGYAFLNGDKIKHGKPFIAAFDTASGQNLYKYKIATNEDYIVQFNHNDKRLFLLFPYKLTSYDLTTGQFVSQKTMPENPKNENVFFANRDLYENVADNNQLHFKQLDSTKQFVITNEHHLMEFDNDLNLLRTSNDTLLYIEKASYNKFKIISKLDDNEMFIIDTSNNNKVTARLNAPFNSVLIKNKLYGIDDDTLVETDLSEILK